MVAEDDMLRAVVNVGPGLACAARELWQRLVPVCACRAFRSHMPHLHTTTACTCTFVRLMFFRVPLSRALELCPDLREQEARVYNNAKSLIQNQPQIPQQATSQAGDARQTYRTEPCRSSEVS